jgi:tetratricopeptide (TPR) repeat protein
MKAVATDTMAKQTPATMRPLALGSAAVFALCGWLALPTVAQQAGGSDSGSGQSSSTSTSSAQNKQQNQQAPPAHKNAAQENPFPADVSKHAAQEQSQPGDAATSAPAAPDAAQQAPQPAHKTAAQENPFPEDVSQGAAAAAAKDSETESSSSSSSSGSSSSSSASDSDPNADPNADVPRDSGRRRLKKPSDKDIQSGSLAGEGRAQDDVRVGRYYLGTGDFKGAYGRYSEAMRLDPTNLDAIYGLAAAAAGLHHTDEALTNYKLYLQIDPDGHDAKSARKALRALSK